MMILKPILDLKIGTIRRLEPDRLLSRGGIVVEDGRWKKMGEQKNRKKKFEKNNKKKIKLLGMLWGA